MKIDGEKLQDKVKAIVRYNTVRGWVQEPEDLSKSIVLESAELLEHFQWDASAKKLKSKKKPKDMQEIEFEVADIFWYLIIFCKVMKIDLVKALEKKMKHNEEKYPESMFKGEHNSKFYHAQKEKYRAAKKQK
ncbi:hypothetical protein A3A84_03230 [Candidatus Collierbacteria bacterium RIFCSPLOWO2_01_FULL_50_23]|uniref:Nucleotide pyrophosphohydrolase n=2 Tax=Candidatus Collieribacteriota TaxID=1752725 RepID=A0A1F5EWF3_9BACT|nr:MAG: hypothetical protein A3D09_03100 [Candidatus Collierbacteria bacterium RIFCSPHIGHO2_02_FULL_49_10]OGD71942.1 MAG: hypothetical protein A2703_00985 [Candidatus Collierbacteria bacterium RIFCSPHIGHO2_01_FULL_50_25]OGD74806.1 MAG: hypothetical protein A3A84_03230 [Candidatus Collierbacteria bacterium RIFCSPLOWO2_01_FULL_50_23]